MIEILDQRTAEKIAAGEVIEQPASVVKELVENSLDAGAGRVEVSVTEGGKKSIKVTDDGCGIAPEELRLAFSRFATSKLSRLEQLDSITSLGFRGEALPGIAAVSRVTFTTRRREDFSAVRIRVEGGEIFPPAGAGAPEGTEVLVEDLFYNTPGRLKFLRGGPQELARISALLTSMALARPGCSFTLISEGRTVLRTTGDGSLLHAIGALYGSKAAAAMIPLQGGDSSSGVTLEGYLSAPHFSRGSRRWITTVVNGRVVQSPLLAGALERAYGGMLARRRHPLAVISLTVPPDRLDVNVHPAKSEIRFHRPQIFNELIFKASRLALQGPPGDEPGVARIKEQQDEWRRQQQQLLYPEDYGWERGKERAPIAATAPPPLDLDLDREGAAAGESHSPSPVTVVESSQSTAPGGCRFIGQFLQSYLVAQRGEELLLIDQHAAHERVLYHALSSAGPGKKEAQLTVPLTLELPPAWREGVEEIRPALEEAGFNLEPFGDNSYILRSVPFPLEAAGEIWIHDFLEDLLQGAPEPGVENRERVLKTMACHHAVKARQPLTREEGEQLLRDWEKTPGAAHCPHGRPAVLRFHRDELDKGFQRKGGRG
ncbi:MAG: DNA mismatch repair endonuclease MutL [Firmicutes bacterium]|nr:DNA mismatch repair endonuclease MutL [Bacillota bacterium]